MKYLLNTIIILLMGVILSPVAGANEFTVAPYLLEVNKESALIACHLKRPMAIKIHIFEDTEPVIFESEEKKRVHYVRITGLSPSKIYRYEIKSFDDQPLTAVGDPGYIIKTASRRGEAFNFAVFGDPRPGETGTYRNHEEVMNQIKSVNPHFLLILGDMVDDGNRSDLWEQFFRTESDVIRSTSMFPVLGDNDYGKGNGLFANYFPFLKERGFYRFEWGGIQFFALNNWDTLGIQDRSEYDEKSEQYQWLSDALSDQDAQSALYRVVFLHDPVYVNRGRSSELIRKTYMPLFDKYGVDIVLASWHLYERSFNKGTYYFISGGGGAELIWMKPNANFPSQIASGKHHFLNIMVNESGMNIQAISKNGTLLDSVAIAPKKSSSYQSNIKEMAQKLAEIKIFSYSGAPEDEPALPVYLFSHGCEYCKKLMNNRFFTWVRNNQVPLKVFHYDLSQHPKVYELFTTTAQKYGRADADLPALFVGDMALSGEMEIEPLFPEELKIFKEAPLAYLKKAIDPFSSEIIETVKEKENKQTPLTFQSSFKGGITDGLNPLTLLPFTFGFFYLLMMRFQRKESMITLTLFLLSFSITTFISAILFFDLSNAISRTPFFFVAIQTILILTVVIFVILFIKGIFKKGCDLQKPPVLEQLKIPIYIMTTFLGIITGIFMVTQTDKHFFQMASGLADPDKRIFATGLLSVYTLSVLIPLTIVCILSVIYYPSRKAKI